MGENFCPKVGGKNTPKNENSASESLREPHPLNSSPQLLSLKVALQIVRSLPLALPQAGQTAPAVLIPTPSPEDVAGSAATNTSEDVAHDWKEHGRDECRTTSPASHPRMPARRGSLLARAHEGTRSSRPWRWRVNVSVRHICAPLPAPTQLRNKLSPLAAVNAGLSGNCAPHPARSLTSADPMIWAPHPVLDALTTVHKGGELGVEDADGPSLSFERCPPPWLALSTCLPRRRSYGRATQNGACVREVARGRARAGVGSLGPAGGVVPASRPLDRFRDRIAAGRSRGACAALGSRVFSGQENGISFHNPTPTGAAFRRTA